VRTTLPGFVTSGVTLTPARKKKKGREKKKEKKKKKKKNEVPSNHTLSPNI